MPFNTALTRKLGIKGTTNTNLFREMPSLTLLSPHRPGRHDVGGLR
jgi:hypothetical protein